jgi:mevalonate kinase
MSYHSADFFETRAFGKWILSGEHTVLRGGEALVFPLKSKSLHLKFNPSVRDLHVEFLGPSGNEYQLLFNGLVERAIELLQIPRSALSGHIVLSSDLPVGGGLGASAALCVVVVKLLQRLDLLDEEKLFSFAHQLENLFHGESSGVDVAVSLGSKPLVFQRGYPVNVFEPVWWPNWYISYSGSRGLTSQCVEKVKNHFLLKQQWALEIDEMMKQSVEQIKQALWSSNSETRLIDLVKGIDRAKKCFESWSLTEGDVIREMNRLTSFGALAVKPTGSGGGGYVLSVWKDNPPSVLMKDLIPLYY